MALDLKRKRTAAPNHRSEKRRHLSQDISLADANRKFSTSDEVDDPPATNRTFPSDSEVSDTSSDGADGEEEAEADGAPSHSGAQFRKPPGGEELRNIKDATDLYRSTSFKLQIDALLPNVRPKYTRSATLDRFLLSLHAHLNALPSITPQHPLAASRALQSKSVAVPYAQPLPTEDSNWKVAFEKPDEIFLGGSWALKTSVKAKDQLKYGVDVAVTMPATLFQEKDYLHGRFFHKRAYFLAVIAASIRHKKSGLNVDVSYQSASGDPRLTILVLQPRKGNATDFTKLNAHVRIIPMLPTDSPIPLQRLSPVRSNIRSASSSDDAPAPASPLYNTSILLSTTPKRHFLSIHTLTEEVPAFRDALALLRVWANQRGYGPGERLCVHGFEDRGLWWAGVLELLVHGEEPLAPSIGKASAKRRPLGKSLSSYQLFKAALDFLARHDFSQEHVFLKTKDGHRFTPQDYNTHEAVLVDSSSLVNLLAGVPLGSLEMLKHDAQSTLELLDQSSISNDPFPAVFLKEQRDTSTRFDIIARVDLSTAKLRNTSSQAVVEHGSAYNALLASIISLLRQGLGDRTKAIALLHPSSILRPVTQALPSNTSTVYIGLILDTEHAFRLVDHGPPAAEQESAATEAFRDFWGDKAELRRFKDGRITESVVWDVSSVEERAQIPTQIVRHVLARHCGVSDAAVWTWHVQFDALLRVPEPIAALYRTGNAATGAKAALAAFDGLVRAIKSLDEELPLAVLNVSPITEALRYTSVFSPVALPTTTLASMPSGARYVAPMDLVLEFEKSGRWPDDLRAVQKIKLAFFERLASALMASQKGLRAAVVVGDSSGTEIQDAARLELLTADGWAFSAHIWHDREATLLEQAIGQTPHVPKHLRPIVNAQERQAALDALAVYRRRFVHAPRHHRAVAALCHRFSAFAGTVRLAKRWLAAHWLLRGHISEEVVELLCARIFLGGAVGGGVPGSKERGFAQVVVLLRDWDWTTELSVPLYGDTEGAGESSVPMVSSEKAGVWAFPTEVDREGHVWTAKGPDALVARRVRAIAKATWDCLQGVESEKLDVMTLFAHPTEHYDFIIELDPVSLPRYYQNIAADPAVWAKRGKYVNLPLRETEQGLSVGFDPAEMLFDDLKRIYKDTFQIFRDPFGGNRFGAVWDPSLKNPRPFRVLGGFSSTPQLKDTEKPKEKDKSLVVLNEVSIFSEIERLGAGLIKKIVVQV
ncbi:Nrap protein [Amylocystis lapponica]|nr:Nrap protein [Amylocystis lapponica]